MIVRYKAVVAGCAALLSGVALAHFPISVSPESDDGLFGVGWTPIQVLSPILPIVALDCEQLLSPMESAGMVLGFVI